jgi:hypothetical protein
MKSEQHTNTGPIQALQWPINMSTFKTEEIGRMTINQLALSDYDIKDINKELERRRPYLQKEEAEFENTLALTAWKDVTDTSLDFEDEFGGA